MVRLPIFEKKVQPRIIMENTYEHTLSRQQEPKWTITLSITKKIVYPRTIHQKYEHTR
jgi:hypothetical protein